MNYKYLLTILLALPLLFSCQSEEGVDNTEVVKQPRLRVTAYFPGSNRSRAQIIYGNEDAETGEIFKWNDKDWITVFNITRLDECPFGLQLETIEIKDDKAIFESHEGLVNPDNDILRINKGDLLFITYGETVRKYYEGSTTLDPRNIFTLGLGTQAGKPQMIVENPGDESLEFMKDNLKMYAIVVAEEDNVIPDIHFTHLSAILRVTLHNATGEDIFPTMLEFEYPNTNSFLNITLYCSVVPDDEGWYKLLNYDTDDFYHGSSPYTDKVSTTINGKDNTTDIGEKIKNGDSYDLYITTVPRLNNDATGDEFIIRFIKNHKTEIPYTKVINNFNVPIEAGLRYWFCLTATPDGTLMFTKDWEDLQKENSDNGTE